VYTSLKKKITNYAGLLSGLMLSLGLVFRTTSILAVPAILLLQKNNNERLKVLMSLIIGVAFVLFYNYYRFGNPLETGYSLAWSSSSFR
jgi:predicted transporter